MDRETVETEAFQEGDSHAVPVSDEKTGAIQSTGVPVAVLSSPEEAHHARRYEFSPKNTGVDGKRNTNAMAPQDFRYYCIEGVVAVLGSVLFGMILCCVIRLWRKRQRRRPHSSTEGRQSCAHSSRALPREWLRTQGPFPKAVLRAAASPDVGSCRLCQSLS
ncbi:uncharacterized protein ACIBXB_008198 [Morphnus guianensis]